MLGRAISSGEEITGKSEVLRAHVHEIVTSRAFRGSRRSCEFLEFVVEKALSGEFDQLKERTLGVQLFRRDPSYDTSEDAIVRVTASDVRKRLQQFYSGLAGVPDLRIELPSGSYIAQFREGVPASVEVVSPAPPLLDPPARSVSRRWALVVLIASIFALVVLLAFVPALAGFKASNAMPWSAILRKDRPLKIVFSDPNIASLQQALDYHLTLSDYASRRYVPADHPVPPEAARFMGAFRGNSVPAVDAGIAVRIGGLVPASRIQTFRARALQPADFKTDDNFVILGSPLSNPWIGLFQGMLEFEFSYDPDQKEEVIRNKRPSRGEAAVYVPTIPGWGTGQAYAIAAFLRNPNQAGYVMILSGSNAAATEATGKFVTNPELVGQTLKAHGMDPRDEQLQFELLLRVTTVATSLNTFEIIACHRLSSGGGRTELQLQP